MSRTSQLPVICLLPSKICTALGSLVERLWKCNQVLRRVWSMTRLATHNTTKANATVMSPKKRKIILLSVSSDEVEEQGLVYYLVGSKAGIDMAETKSD